jgi:hypothetical protein
MKKANHSINPNDIKTRDYLIVAIITGTTKSGIYEDEKKKRNKESCRRWKYNNQED